MKGRALDKVQNHREIPQLAEAQRIIQARREKYAEPGEDFARTAAMMTALGFRVHVPSGPLRDRPILPADVATIMMLVKISREHFCHQPDNLLDIIGYCVAKSDVSEDAFQKEA